ncbi:hypothetical protein BOX15_Mlig019365g1, partial [Macrostomum lignano]
QPSPMATMDSSARQPTGRLPLLPSMSVKSEAASSADVTEEDEQNFDDAEDYDEEDEVGIGLPRHHHPSLLLDYDEQSESDQRALLLLNSDGQRQDGGAEEGGAPVVRTRRRKAALPVDARFCAVCSEPATGYNFDRLTCESCKAFFRRNALKSRERIKPCSRGGGCDVSGPQRKHCPTCRLEKCLRVGMKKELILPPEKLEQRAKPKKRTARQQLQLPWSSSESAAAAASSPRGGVLGVHNRDSARRRASAVFLDHLLSTQQQQSQHRQPQPPQLQSRPVTTGALALAWSEATLAGRTWSSELTSNELECLDGLREAQDRLSDALQMSDCDRPDGGEAKDGVGRLEQAFNQMEACIRRIISVVKLIPIFSEVDKDSQILMLKVNIYGLVILYSSFFFNPVTGSWEIPLASSNADDDQESQRRLSGSGGVSLMRELAAAVAAIVSMHPGSSDLTLADLDQYCANSHNVYARLELYSRHDSTVKMLMLALKLFNTDSMPASPARDSLERAQSFYSLLLKKYLAREFGVPDAMQLYPRLLLTFIDMRTVENKMVEFTRLLSVESLNPLVREFAHVT